MCTIYKDNLKRENVRKFLLIPLMSKNTSMDERTTYTRKHRNKFASLTVSHFILLYWNKFLLKLKKERNLLFVDSGMDGENEVAFGCINAI